MKPKKILKNWTREEEEYLLESYKIKLLSEVAKELGRGGAGVYGKLRVLTNGDMSERFGGKSGLPWTEEEESFLLDNPQMSTTAIARRLERSVNSVNNKKHALKNTNKIEKKKREENKPKKPSKFEIEREKREQEAYERLISEPVIARLRLSDVKVKLGQVYVVANNNPRTKNKNYFKGEVIQITNRHVTLRNSRNLRETFLKTDILMKEYEFKEVV